MKIKFKLETAILLATLMIAGASTATAAAPNLTLTLNATMDDNPPIVNNITSAVLLDTSGNTIATATLPDNMTAQFSLSGISPGDYFIEVNGLAGDHLPTRIDSNASDINQSAGLRLQHSIIGNISNPTYRIEVFPSGLDSHPVVNYATVLNETIYNFVIVPGNTSRIEVRVLNTSAELSNFSTALSTHDGLSVPFQKWILGDFTDSTGAFIGNHGHVYNNTDSNCNGCHGSLDTKAANISDIAPNNGWCFRCHNGKTGPDNGFIDPRAVVAANGTIAGNVTNASSGLSISGATVTANGMMATTDANGSYSISIAAGTYTVTANATGYNTNSTSGIVVGSGATVAQNFALTPGVAPIVNGTIKGTVTNASSGLAIVGATVAADTQSNITDANGNYSINIAAGTYTVTANATGYQTDTTTGVVVTSGNVTTQNFALTPTTAPTPKLTLTLNNTMDGTSPPLVNNITSAVLLDTSGNNVATAALPDNMTAQFSLSGISPGDYFIEVNGLAGDHLPTRIDSNTSDINQSAGLRLRNSVIGDISNPTYRIKVYPSGNPPVVNSSHPVVNYATGANESIYNFVIVPGNTSRIEVRVLNTSAELSNFTPFSDTHPAGTNFSSEPFQIWILGDITNSTGAFIGNHGHLYNNTDSNCNTCHGSLDTKASTFSAITTSNGWCFRCHYGKTGPRNGFVDPTVVAAANGTIAGNVTNASSGLAISGATVAANGMMATTDANGSYSINIAAGTYTVTANATGYQTNTTTGVVVTSGNVTTQNFALTPLVTPQTFNISGFKINDTNGNGAWDAGEMGIENWNIKLFNNSGTQAASTSTDASGFYKFTNLIPDRYNVTEETKAGFTPTNATIKAIIVENMDVMNVNFTNQVTVPPPQTFNISGFKVNDTNGDNIWEPGEMGIENWNIMLLNATTGTQINSTSTNASGFYEFMNLAPGVYNVTEEMKAGFTPSGVTFKAVTIENMDVTDVDFLNHVAVPPPQTFNISGFKINGTDNNGMGIDKWNIMLLNATGAQIASTMTDSTGFYSFTGLTSGTYNVAEGMMTGWTNTSTSPMSRMVVINGADVPNVNFTNMLLPPKPATFDISGFKINDTNGNGVWDPGEMGIDKWNIMLQDDKGTQIASTSTDVQGFYQFTGLDPGTYKVTEEMKPGFTPSSDTSKDVTIENKDVKDVNFLNHVTVPPAVTNTISGFKINDLNGNGKQDQGEEGLPGWNIKLTGIVPETAGINMETTTDDNGFYSFENLPAGMYLVVETVKGDYVPSGSPVLVVNLENGMNSMNNNFMNRPVSSLVPDISGVLAKTKITKKQ